MLTRWALADRHAARPRRRRARGAWRSTPGRLSFEATTAQRLYIGRLDTATGNLLTWRFPGATASRVVVAPDGTVLFNAWNGSGPYRIARLRSGDRRVHQLVARQPTTVSDGGRSGWAASSSRMASSDYVGVARLVPATGRLTEWRTPAIPSDSLSFLSGRVYFGADGDLWLECPRSGRRRETNARSATRSCRAPSLLGYLTSPRPPGLHPFSRPSAWHDASPFNRRRHGGFETWRMATPPRMTASIPGAVYFTEDAYGTIARLERQAAVHSGRARDDHRLALGRQGRRS